MHWLTRRLDGAHWSAEDEGHLQRWLQMRPEHLAEYRAAEATLALMSQPGAFAPAEISRVLARHAGPAPAKAGTHPTRRRVLRLAAAAVLAAGAATLWFAWPQGPTHATGLAETRTMTLPDGTVAHLDAQTGLDYADTGGWRTVRLHHGTAVFEVAPGQLPFQVVAGSWTVRDIGTTFQVQLRSVASQPAVEVAVAEGEVELSSHLHPTTPVRLMEGEETTWSTGSDRPEPTARASSRADFATWREGRFRYRNQPLPHVLEDLQRYHPGKIVLKDRSLAAHTVTGTLSPRDLPQALHALEAILPLKATPTPGGDIEITRR